MPYRLEGLMFVATVCGTCHFTVDLKEHILHPNELLFGASRANGSACGQKCRFPRAFHVHVQRVVGQHIDTQKKFFGVFRPSGQPADTAQALGHGDVSPVSRFYPQKDAGFLSHHPSGCGTTSAWSLVFRISGHGGLFLPPADPFEPQGRNLPPVSRSAHPALQGKSIRVLYATVCSSPQSIFRPLCARLPANVPGN